MQRYEFDTPMPDTYSDLLKELVSKSIEQKSLTGTWHELSQKKFQIHIGENVIIGETTGRPVLAFATLGFIEILSEKSIQFILTPKAFAWAEYQKKNRFGKWVARNPSLIRDGFIAFSFVVSLTLAIIEVLQAVKIIPTP